MDAPESIAFDERAPLPERHDAQSILQQTYLPSESDLIPSQTLMPIIEAIKGAAEERELIKSAQVIQGPWRGPATQGRIGLRSVKLDRLQVFAYADFWDKPANAGFDLLRSMVDQTPVLSGIVLTRIRQVSRFTQLQEDDGPGFVIRHVERDHAVSKDEAAAILALTSFIRNCGWERDPRKRKRLGRDNFAQFMAKSVRDSLTLDAAPIETETKRDARLGLDGFYAVDGATVRLCTEDGYRGNDEVFAVQVLQNSNIVTAYTYDDLVYEVRNPRSDVRLSGYGLSETELLIRCVTGFLNAMTYNAKGFDDNAIPRGLLHLSGDYSDNDLAAFKRYWNAMVKGISNAWTLPVLVSKDQESKASFERFGIEFNEMYFSKWMTFLASLICAIYGMSPDEINFESFSAGRSSLSGSDTAEKLADSKDKGLRPLLAYYESLISDYLIQTFSDKYCFRWAGLDKEDLEKRHEMRKLVLTVDEIRAQEGYDNMGGLIGGAPVNPSLVGLYQQQAQPPQQPSFGDRGPQQEDHGGESGPGGYDDTAGAQEDSYGEDGPGGGEKQGQKQGGEDDPGGLMRKANPHHDEAGRFTFGVGEMPGLLDKPDIQITLSRNQVHPGERLSDAGARAKRKILTAFANAGGSIKNGDSRHSIMITGSSVNHMLHLGEKHQPWAVHMEAAFCADDLIRRAVLAERHQDRKDANHNLYVARYYAPFSHDGKIYRCKLTVLEHREPGGGFKLYDHALSELELSLLKKESPAVSEASRGPGYKEGLEGPSSSASGAALVSISPGSKLSIASLLSGVNRDVDGLPFGTHAVMGKSLEPVSLDFGTRRLPGDNMEVSA